MLLYRLVVGFCLVWLARLLLVVWACSKRGLFGFGFGYVMVWVVWLRFAVWMRGNVDLSCFGL